MKRCVLLCTFFLWFAGTASPAPQDTVRVMFYNILKWENDDDVTNFRTILKYSRPDIIALTEVQTRSIAREMYECVSSSIPENPYDTTDFYSISYFDKGNMLFYNSAKLSLKLQDTILPVGHRYINRYLLYAEPVLTDTVFLDLYVAHFRPSPTQASVRYAEAKTFQNYLLSQTDCRNVVFSGDLNLYSGDEPAYKLLLDSGNCRLNDPLNARGAWDNDPAFATVHTQSPTALDSRFDFLLSSGDLINGSNNIKYIPGTYRALGNDGAHYNQAINAAPANTSVPADVAQALFEKSDHLPVVMELLVIPPFPAPEDDEIDIYVHNTVGENVEISIVTSTGNPLIVRVYNTIGQLVYDGEINPAGTYHYYSIPAASWSQGVYLIEVSDNAKHQKVKKIHKLK